MNDAAAQTLKTSKDPVAVKRAALDLANSADPADLAALQAFLSSSASLLKIDSAEDYKGTIASLRLTSIMEVLSENPAPAAAQLLLKLTTADPFNDDVLRMILLTQALAVIRPSPPAAITYWDSLSEPGSPIAFDVVKALCVNQSEPAMALLQRKFSNPQEKPDQKTSWMRLIILPIRNDPPLLACCERLVLAGEPKGTQIELIEALFDYNEDWYRGCEIPQAPLLATASKPARETFRRIADHALKTLKLPPALEAKVKATYELLDAKK